MAQLHYHESVLGLLESLAVLDDRVGPIELVQMWFSDLYFPGQSIPEGYSKDVWEKGQREWRGCFTEEELAVLAKFHEAYEAEVDSLSDSWLDYRQDPGWLGVAAAARHALARLGREVPAQSDDFNAACVAMEEDSDRWLVGFSDTEFNTQRYLTLQRWKSPELPDIKLGLDGYYVEVDDQRRCRYGGIKCFELFHDRAVVEFENDWLSAIGDERVLVIGFALRQRQLDQLRDCLTRIFEGYDCFVDRSV